MKEPKKPTVNIDSEGQEVLARRKYDAEFKQAAVDLCIRNGGKITQTARELGVSPWNIKDWMKVHRRKTAPPPLTPEQLQRENAQLKLQLARAKEQRDILKKSLGILSQP